MHAIGAARDRATPVFLYVCCFFSGAAALCYEITWAKTLSHTFGSTLGGTAAVVAGFLGGMGMGAWAYHRARDRVGHPLLLYAILELGIAASAIAASRLLDLLPDLFGSIAFALPGGLALTLTRFAMTFLVLLLPSALMGATFPALCTVLIDSRAGVDRHLGALYGVNTVGGAAGALVTGVVLLEWLGLRGSAFVGAATNAAIGIVAIAWRRRPVGRHALATSAEAAAPTELPQVLTGAVLFGSGFATLAYEILWFRGLQHLFGNSTYALTVMLVIFLIGLGFGAQLLGPLSRTRSPARDLALCQLGIGLFAVLAVGLQSLVVNDRSVTSLAAHVNMYGPFRNSPWVLRLAVTGLGSLAMMLPATLLMGLSFPMASRLFLSDVRHLGERVGGAVLLSNLGCILGSVAAALWILPLAGVVRGTHGVALLNFGLAGALLLRLRLPLGKRAALFLAPALVAAVLAFLLPSHSAPWLVARGAREMKTVFLEEGHLSTVSVQVDPTFPDRKSIALDGINVGVTRGLYFNIYQKQAELAHLPLALDRRVRDVLSIGLGSGATHAALLAYPELRHVTCVEINAAVLRGAERFEFSKAWSDPRSRIVVDDALHFLRAHPEQFDLIISDGKQAADFSGNAKLLARDFYALALSRLRPDGLFVQWLPPTIEPTVFRSVLRAAVEVFPELELFHDLPAAVYLVGSRTPLAGRPRRTDAQIVGLPVSSDLASIYIPDLDALRSRWLADKRQLRSVLGEGPVSTWDRSPAEFAPYKLASSRFSDSLRTNLAMLIEANGLGRPEIGDELAPPDTTSTRVMSGLRAAQLDVLQLGPGPAQRRAAALLRQYPDDPMARHWERQFRGPRRTP